MTNRIDFQTVEEDGLMLPAIRPVVFVEGQLCSFLGVKEVVQAGNPVFGSARLICNDMSSSRMAAGSIAMGKRVTICQMYDDGVGQAIGELIGIFEGYVEGIEKKFDSDGEHVEIIARDMAGKFERVSVHGKRVSRGGETSLFMSGGRTVFNADGSGDASNEEVACDGKVYRIFAGGVEEGQKWSLAEITFYLLNEYLPYGQIEIPSVEQMEAVMQYRKAQEFDVEGLSLLKALEKVCEQARVSFRFVCRHGSEGASTGIVFYRPGQERQVELNLQAAGESLSVSHTTVNEYQSKQSYWPITHRYVGKGSYKIFEATFDLVKGWDPGSEGGVYADYSIGSSGFENVRDVYRKWCLNEAGDYSGVPYEQGSVFDFGDIFETDEYLRRRRRFVEALSFGENGESLGYYLEVSYDSGQSWQKYDDEFDVLSDECGVWLGADEIGTAMWDALQSDSCRLRITASVESDERLMCSYADGPVDSVVEVVDHILSLDGKYNYRKVSDRSIFFNSINGSDEIDESESLLGYVRERCQKVEHLIEQITVRTPFVMTGFLPGDRVVCSPRSRDVLGVRRDSRSCFRVDSASIDFEKQMTKLKILRKRELL